MEKPTRLEPVSFLPSQLDDAELADERQRVQDETLWPKCWVTRWYADMLQHEHDRRTQEQVTGQPIECVCPEVDHYGPSTADVADAICLLHNRTLDTQPEAVGQLLDRIFCRFSIIAAERLYVADGLNNAHTAVRNDLFCILGGILKAEGLELSIKRIPHGAPEEN